MSKLNPSLLFAYPAAAAATTKTAIVEAWFLHSSWCCRSPMAWLAAHLHMQRLGNAGEISKAGYKLDRVYLMHEALTKFTW